MSTAPAASDPSFMDFSTPVNNKAYAISRVMYGLCITCSVVIILMLVLITGYLLLLGIGNFIWHDGKWWEIWNTWHTSFKFFYMEPISDLKDPDFPGGMVNGLLGTITLITMSSLVGIPVGVFAGVYLSEYDAESYFSTPVRFIADVVAGVPSIVVGILFYELLVHPFHTNSAWAGASALAF